MKKAMRLIEDQFESTGMGTDIEKEGCGNNKEPLRDEMSMREKEAFLEGYRYAIRVLEDGLVKEHQ